MLKTDKFRLLLNHYSSWFSAENRMLLQLNNITKRFPGIVANDNISLSLKKGEIHAIVGENGAGKTTLMNILYGLQQPDEGEILLNDRPVHFHSPGDAISHGIGMVHQHFMLIPSLTVTENVILGEKRPQRKQTGLLSRYKRMHNMLLDMKQAEQKILALSERFGLDVTPSSTIKNLAVGVRQRVEIIKALYRDVKLLILDEPTSVLTPQETTDFFRILKTLVQQGMSVIFITHKPPGSDRVKRSSKRFFGRERSSVLWRLLISPSVN